MVAKAFEGVGEAGFDFVRRYLDALGDLVDVRVVQVPELNQPTLLGLERVEKVVHDVDGFEVNGLVLRSCCQGRLDRSGVSLVGDVDRGGYGGGPCLEASLGGGCRCTQSPGQLRGCGFPRKFPDQRVATPPC